MDDRQSHRANEKNSYHPTVWMIMDTTDKLRAQTREESARCEALCAHRCQQFADMGEIRPNDLVDGILYDVTHLYRMKVRALHK